MARTPILGKLTGQMPVSEKPQIAGSAKPNPEIAE
jgi:hypothetical protein